MKALWSLIATTLLPFASVAGNSFFWEPADSRTLFNGELWQVELADFSPESYSREVDGLLADFEEHTGRALAPGKHRLAALKIYTNSGNGLQTPKGLVIAVIDALLRRGFRPGEICLIDAKEENLRDAGYLPPLSRMGVEGAYFRNIRVYAMDNGELESPVWYYESPLPREFSSPLGRELLRAPVELNPQEARKSYLPDILLEGVDFWINLPVASHHPGTGPSGALVNASLWNITNGTRFFNRPANAPVAVAEIAAIPELADSLALNLVSLEHFQYIGGPAFNANYTGSRPEVWMSVDPVIMDANLVVLLNEYRQGAGFEPFPELPEYVVYAMELGLGNGIAIETRTIHGFRGDR
ncbi:MAG: DUF362 domain-containing protein [Oceanipulchritudo sp.]